MASETAQLPIIALLFGDCTGIGPEIAAKVLAERTLADRAHLVAVGDARVLEKGMRDAKVSFPWHRVERVSDIDWDNPSTPLIDLRNINPADVGQGAVSPDSGRITGETLRHAIMMAKNGDVDAVTFAPLNKAAMYAGGFRFPDEHKFFANVLGHNSYFSEMNVLDPHWMSRVTSHVSLREALDLINENSITDAIELADRMMKRAGIDKPRIAVAALNPHAGENGLFGREEIDLIRPTVEKVAATGINVTGPFPSDTVYIRAFNGEFDSVVSMYHDQGQIATKMKGFNRGVTITAGLDVLFTTPAHGTAFDIVGQGVASTGGLESALALAAKLAASKGARS